MNQYVCCGAGVHHLGIEVLTVREIVCPTQITPVPFGPTEVRGLINLRGRIISVFDMGVCLGSEPITLTEDSRIVVLRTETELAPIRSREHRADLRSSEEAVGLLIDSLGDIVAVGEEDLEAPPANFALADTPFVSSVFSVNKALHSVLDVEKMIISVTGMDAAA